MPILDYKVLSLIIIQLLHTVYFNFAVIIITEIWLNIEDKNLYEIGQNYNSIHTIIKKEEERCNHCIR